MFVTLFGINLDDPMLRAFRAYIGEQPAEMRIALSPLTGMGRLMGKTVNMTSTVIVWTISGTARLLIKPFTS